MGFLDKAKAAATELSAKADQALASQGLAGPSVGGKQADKFFRDLGVLAYLDATGRPSDAGERDRIMTALHGFEAQGALPSFALQTAAPPPPPPPGAAAQAPRGYAATTAQLGRRAASAAPAELGCCSATSASVTTAGRVGTAAAGAQPPVRDASVQTWAYSAVIRSMRCSTSGRRSAHALIPTSSRP